MWRLRDAEPWPVLPSKPLGTNVPVTLRGVHGMKRFLPALALVLGLSYVVAQAPAYFVHADMVRGAQGAQGAVCVANAVFHPGEWVIFRAVVYDAASGEELTHDAIAELGLTARVMVEGLDPIEMFYPPLEAGAPPAMYFFRGPWPIPVDFAMGDYRWNVEVTDAAGHVVTFAPIGQGAGLSSITILAGAQ